MTRLVRLPRHTIERLRQLEDQATQVVDDLVQTLRDAGVEIPDDYTPRVARAPDRTPVALEIPTPAAPEEPTHGTTEARTDDPGDDGPDSPDHPGDAAE